MNLNKAFVLGRLTRDPDRRNLPSGQPVVSFGVASNRYYTTQEGEKKEETEFHNITIFGKLAETAHQYLRKGSLVLIEGRLRTRSWQDASSGQKRYRTEIIAERMQLGPRASQTAPSIPPSAQPEPQIKTALSDEEIPVIEEEEAKPAELKKEENNKPGNNPKDNPLSNDNGDIDVSKIPF